jgi:hypothetical protein
MVSLRPCRTFRGPAFDRFDATLSRVEYTPDLTLPDLERSVLRSVATFPVAKCEFSNRTMYSPIRSNDDIVFRLALN